MKIEKYRYLSNGRYKVIIDSKEYILYEDVILKYNILSLKEIDYDTLKKYLKDNDYYEAYYLALKYLKVKLRTPLEIEKYLIKKSYSKDIINKVISRLKTLKYLDDNRYTVSYINDQINLKNVGPLKIKSDLEKLGINKDVIINNLKIYTKDIEEAKIKKYIDKEVKFNTNKSLWALKNNLFTKLFNKGFSKEIILKYLHGISLDEKEIYRREYNKIYNRLAKKYSGKDLELKVKQKLIQKGFYVN